MAETCSFDIVSEVNLQEADNAVNQAKKELSQRYDFRNSKASVDLDRNAKELILIADDDTKLQALTDILCTKMVKRGISLKSLVFAEPQRAFEGTMRQKVEITMGIPKEKAKDLVKIIKEFNSKIQAQIEGEKLKVSSGKKDELQAVIAHLKAIDFPLALNFCNYR